MKENHFHTPYLCSIAGKPEICMGIRLKGIKIKKGKADCSYFQPIYWSSIANKFAICMGIKMLPETNTNVWNNDGLEADFEETEETSNTYQIDMETKMIPSKCDGIEAMKQAVYLILGTQRYEHCIYSWNYGLELQSLMGMPKSYCIPELQRRITEALEQDQRIESVNDFKFAEEGNKIMAEFTVNTIYGEV